MFAQESYRFQKNKFNNKGINIENGLFFLDVIKEWEIDFHKKYPFCFANHLFANNSTMILLDGCLDIKSNEESCGMDLIDGQIDLETNLKIEDHCQIKSIYGIGSAIEINEDEPLYLVIDDKLADGTVILKYKPDNDSEETETPIPIEFEILKKVK